MAQSEELPWRVGRRVGRTVFAQLGVEPDDDDRLIGVMDSRILAEAVVRAHNMEVAKECGRPCVSCRWRCERPQHHAREHRCGNCGSEWREDD